MKSDAVTWRSYTILGQFGQPTESGSYIREQVRDSVDQFLNAYLAANPKPKWASPRSDPWGDPVTSALPVGLPIPRAGVPPRASPVSRT